jgi:TldD protein
MNHRPLWTRRDVMKSMAAAGAGMTAAQLMRPSALSALGMSPPFARRRASVPDPAILIDGTDVHALAMRALDAAKLAGATYADVRITRQLTQGLTDGELLYANELIAVGVRVRVDAGWGFAASPYWDADEMTTLAREAVHQARANAASSAPTEWVPIPIATGSWATPVRVDPFVVSVEEKLDFLQNWCGMSSRYRACDASATAAFTREERAVATTDGAYFTQTLYQSSGNYSFTRSTTEGRQRMSSATAAGLELTAAGWEIFAEADLPGQLPSLYAGADPLAPATPTKSGDVGRYDVVFDAATMASLLAQTIGVATQVDRALGLEANGGGTSYLGPDPLALLGTYQVAAPLVTVTANRSMPRGTGTVKWDDEGVVPDDFALVNDGVLVDYQTTREQAGWLAPWYQKRGRPVQSHGCAAAQDATCITMAHAPNLVLEPGRQDLQFTDLIADTKRGFAVVGGSVGTDFQARTGTGRGTVREIVNGRLGSIVGGLTFSFSAPQLWKKVVALGGASSAMQFALTDAKGQPSQSTPHSVRAVPAKITDVDFIDQMRRG